MIVFNDKNSSILQVIYRYTAMLHYGRIYNVWIIMICLWRFIHD
jgi:hypothetical protein